MITQQEIAAFVEQTGAAINLANTGKWDNINEQFITFGEFIRFASSALPRALEIIKEQAARIEELERGKDNEH